MIYKRFGSRGQLNFGQKWKLEDTDFRQDLHLHLPWTAKREDLAEGESEEKIPAQCLGMMGKELSKKKKRMEK